MFGWIKCVFTSSAIALTLSACHHSPSPPPKVTENTDPSPNSIVFDKQLTFLTGQNRTGFKSGNEYATLVVQIDSFNQPSNEKLKANIGNFLRRFLWEEDHAASLVLTVSKNLPDPGTGVIKETNIVEVPIFSIVYTEDGTPSESAIVDTGKQITPWFRVESGETINFSYAVKSSRDVRTVLADKIVELGKTSATIVGSAGTWVLNELTSPHVSKLASDFDKEINRSFSYSRQSTRKVQLGVLTDVRDRYGAAISIYDEGGTVTAEVQVILDFRPTKLSDTWDANTRVPVIDKSPVAIKSMIAGVRTDQTLEWLIENENKSWYPSWKTTSDSMIFARGCENLQKALHNTARLGNYDTAAAMWAELSRHQGYLQTPKFHEVNCLDVTIQSRLKALGMEIEKPLNNPRERKLTIEERDKSLNRLIAVMLPQTTQSNAMLFAEEILEQRVQLHDPDGPLHFDTMIEAGRNFASRTLRSLDIVRAGCYISSPSENAATRHFIALQENNSKPRMLQIEAVFSLVGPTDTLPKITAIKVTKAEPDDNFVTRIRENRGVFEDGHPNKGKPRGCGEDYDWYPWNQTT